MLKRLWAGHLVGLHDGVAARQEVADLDVRRHGSGVLQQVEQVEPGVRRALGQVPHRRRRVDGRLRVAAVPGVVPADGAVGDDELVGLDGGREGRVGDGLGSVRASKVVRERGATVTGWVTLPPLSLKNCITTVAVVSPGFASANTVVKNEVFTPSAKYRFNMAARVGAGVLEFRPRSSRRRGPGRPRRRCRRWHRPGRDRMRSPTRPAARRHRCRSRGPR